MKNQSPSRTEEKRLRDEGYRLIAGVDEAGRGALIGPVVAAAVIMPEKVRGRWGEKVRDSKLLTPATRESLCESIMEAAVAVGTGSASHAEIDRVGIVRATRMAMKAAVDMMGTRPEYVLIDYMRLPEINIPQKGITNGDRLCFTIACASIVAKVTRDRMLVRMDSEYPGYGLAKHKGYGTKEHLECLNRLGPCPMHRRSFRPVIEAMCRWI